MAAAKDNAKVTKKLADDSKRSTAGAAEGEAPKSAYPDTRDDGAGVGRRAQVGTPVKSTFDERTGVQHPFVMEDGTQDNGARDLSEPEGARATTTREGNKSTVEETKVAADKGIVPKADAREPEEGDEKPKNPVN